MRATDARVLAVSLFAGDGGMDDAAVGVPSLPPVWSPPSLSPGDTIPDDGRGTLGWPSTGVGVRGGMELPYKLRGDGEPWGVASPRARAVLPSELLLGLPSMRLWWSCTVVRNDRSSAAMDSLVALCDRRCDSNSAS